MIERMVTTIVVMPNGMFIEHGTAQGKLFAQGDNWDCYITKRGKGAKKRHATALYMVCLAAQELGIKQMSIRMV